MDILNAFVGKTAKPTAEEISSALGSSAKVWQQFLDWLASEHDITIQEWKSYSPKYGWNVKLKLKKRTIVHMSPCPGCFQVMFIFGDKAVKAAQQSDLPADVAKTLAEAPHYPEGTGLRLLVKKAGDLAAIRKLVAVKLAN